jgi:hypothetical protein
VVVEVMVSNSMVYTTQVVVVVGNKDNVEEGHTILLAV